MGAVVSVSWAAGTRTVAGGGRQVNRARGQGGVVRHGGRRDRPWARRACFQVSLIGNRNAWVVGMISEPEPQCCQCHGQKQQTASGFIGRLAAALRSSSGRTPAIEECSGAAYPPIPHASSIWGKIAGTASRLLHLSGPILLFTVPPAVRARFISVARRGMVGVVGVGVCCVKPRVPKKLVHD